MSIFARVQAAITPAPDAGHAPANVEQARCNAQIEKDLDAAYAAAGKPRPGKGTKSA